MSSLGELHKDLANQAKELVDKNYIYIKNMPAKTTGVCTSLLAGVAMATDAGPNQRKYNPRHTCTRDNHRPHTYVHTLT